MQNTNIQTNMELTNAEFRALRTDTTNQFQALIGAFTESMKNSIAAQETQISMQFAELKDLMLTQQNAAVGVSPPQKKPKKNEE